MTTQEFIEKNYANGCGDWMFSEAIEKYAKMKCQELLEIVSNIEESEQYGKFYFDKDSILNAVDLEKLCS